MSMKENNNNQQESDRDFSGIINKIKNYLLEYYEPVQDAKDADFHYSTNELWEQLLKIFPNELILRPEMVAQWLHIGGFTFYDFGEMRLEWILKRKAN